MGGWLAHQRISCGRDDGEMGSTECLGVSVWTSLLCAGIRRGFHHWASQWDFWEQFFHFHVQLLIFDHNHTAFGNPVSGAMAVPNAWDWCLKDRLWSQSPVPVFSANHKDCVCWAFFILVMVCIAFLIELNGCKTISVIKPTWWPIWKQRQSTV